MDLGKRDEKGAKMLKSANFSILGENAKNAKMGENRENGAKSPKWAKSAKMTKKALKKPCKFIAKSALGPQGAKKHQNR